MDFDHPCRYSPEAVSRMRCARRVESGSVIWKVDFHKYFLFYFFNQNAIRIYNLFKIISTRNVSDDFVISLRLKKNYLSIHLEDVLGGARKLQDNLGNSFLVGLFSPSHV